MIRERATGVVQKNGLSEFQITDETQALEKVLPRLDAAREGERRRGRCGGRRARRYRQGRKGAAGALHAWQRFGDEGGG